jgi:mono/diheme cytochrome c family protein
VIWRKVFVTFQLLLATLAPASNFNHSMNSAQVRIPGSSPGPSGRELYLKYCARCHGKSGRGDGPQTASLSFRPHSFADCGWMEMRSDAVLFLLIKDGSGIIGLPPAMHGFGDRLGTDQIAALVRYVRSFCQGKSAPNGVL